MTNTKNTRTSHKSAQRGLTQPRMEEEDEIHSPLHIFIINDAI